MKYAEVAIGLRLWQSEVNMTPGQRRALMTLVDRLWPPLAKELEQFKQSGGVS